MTTQNRNQTYYQLSSQLAQIDNAHLCILLGENEPSNGWGRNQIIEVGDTKVFVKRVPVTDIEHENIFSTANLYELPIFYNYGFGSAGLSVWRELVAHIKTTNWVLSGEMERFPFLYHYRMIPFVGEHAEIDLDQHSGYVEYWGGSQNIGQYMLDRTNAKHELVLFLEYVPYVLHSWLEEHPSQVDGVLDQLRATIDFLRKNEIIHLDAHSHNVLTDGENVYLTDFGLLLDKRFSLQPEEVAFFNEHSYFDYGEVLTEVGYLVYSAYEALPEESQLQLKKKFDISEEIGVYEIGNVLLNNLETIYADGLIP